MCTPEYIDFSTIQLTPNEIKIFEAKLHLITIISLHALVPSYPLFVRQQHLSIFREGFSLCCSALSFDDISIMFSYMRRTFWNDFCHYFRWAPTYCTWSDKNVRGTAMKLHNFYCSEGKEMRNVCMYERRVNKLLSPSPYCLLVFVLLLHSTSTRLNMVVQWFLAFCPRLDNLSTAKNNFREQKRYQRSSKQTLISCELWCVSCHSHPAHCIMCEAANRYFFSPMFF